MNTAIIVLNYNDYETTLNFVNTIKDYKSINKIVVVDNNSPSGDFEKLSSLKYDKVEVIKSEANFGYSYGNNYGIKYLEKRYGVNFFDTYIISNPDVFVDDITIEATNKYLHENEDVAIASPRMHYENKVARRSAWKKRTFLIDVANSTRLTQLLMYPIFKSGEYSKKDYIKNKHLEVFTLSGSFFLIKSKILREIGYLDENVFLFFEEDVLGSKIAERGYKIISMNDLKFIHYDSRTIGKLMSAFKKQKIMFESRKYYHKEYNKVSNSKLVIFDILYYIRCAELVIEVPIRKLMSMIRKNGKA